MQIDAAPLIIRELVTLPPEARAQASAAETRTKTDRANAAPPEPAARAGRSRACDDCAETGAGTPERPGRTYQTNADGDSAELNSLVNQLSEDEQHQVDELKERDAEVRAHEAAHLAAAGPLARGGARYEFQRGPDGNRYAVGGHVDIDTSPAETPEATLEKAAQIRAAALAPGDPSSADRSVAAKAAQMAAKARRELAEQGSRGGSSAESGSPDHTGSIDPATPAPPGTAPRLDLLA